MTSPAIRTEKLSKVYTTGLLMRRSVALHGLDLEVEAGETFGFIGHNGAGKTTAIKILMGLNFATSGRAWLLGQPHDSMGVRERVGFLPERPYFYDYLTAREFLEFYARLFRLPSALRKERIDGLLRLVDLERCRDVPLRRFSKGMLQRIGVCQALVNDPDLVVLDEPMSGLDPIGRTLIRDAIASLKQRGKTVFFSTHILSDVEAICDRVAMLANGHLLDVGRVDDLLAARTRFVEVMTEPLPPERVERFRPLATRIDHQPRRTLLRAADGDAVQVLLRALLDGGVTVYEVVQRRETLEELFVAEAKAAAPRTGAVAEGPS